MSQPVRSFSPGAYWDSIFREVEEELLKAMEVYAPQSSMMTAIDVIRKQIIDLHLAATEPRGLSGPALRRECVQIMAMAMRFILEQTPE